MRADAHAVELRTESRKASRDNPAFGMAGATSGGREATASKLEGRNVKNHALTNVLLGMIAGLLALNLAITWITATSRPAMAQAQGPRVVGVTMDQKYVYRMWSNGTLEAVYCRWVGDQDPASRPNQWVNATPKNTK